MPTPENAWTTPDIIVGIVAIVVPVICSIIGHFIATAKSRKDRAEAKQYALDAKKDSDRANSARDEIVAKLAEANEIAANAHQLRKREIEHHLVLTASLLADAENSSLVATVTNKGLLPATIDFVAFCEGDSTTACFPLGTDSLSFHPSQTIEPSRKTEFAISLRAAVYLGDVSKFMPINTLCVRFEHEQRVFVSNADITEFIKLCVRHADKIKNTPVKFQTFQWGTRESDFLDGPNGY